MAITKPTKALPFPKGEYKKKINGQTKFDLISETFTLEATAQFDSLHGAQLQYLPARIQDAVNQVIADPVVNCLTDANTRTVKFVKPTGTEPATGEVYLDLYSGTIQFNSADAGKQFQVNYYRKASLIDHNAMNRIWESGVTYLVGDSAHHDFDSLDTCLAACVGGETIKVLKNITSTGITVPSVKVRIDFNNFKLIKSGSVTSSRALSVSEDFVLENCVFDGWDEAGDICVYVSADKYIQIYKNNAVGNTNLTNASSVATNCIVQGNLPLNSNYGISSGTTIEVRDASNSVSGVASILEFNDGSLVDLGSGLFKVNNIGNYNGAYSIAGETISVGDAVYLENTGKIKKVTSTYLNSSSPRFCGFALTAGVLDDEILVAMSGIISCFSGLTPGLTYFLKVDGTVATYTASQIYDGSTTGAVLKLGIALSNSQILVSADRKKYPRLITASSDISLSTNSSSTLTYNASGNTVGLTRVKFVGGNSSNPFTSPYLKFTGVNAGAKVTIDLGASTHCSIIEIFCDGSDEQISLIPLEILSTTGIGTMRIRVTVSGLSSGTVDFVGRTLLVEEL